MKVYNSNKIRNLALIGHSGSGKTTLTEAILYVTGVTKRQGRIEDGNTVSDFDEEEISRNVSIGTTLIPAEWKDMKYNFLDTPGYFDFAGEMYGALRASESAIILVEASSGVEVGTEKAVKYTEEKDIPKFIFVNKMDKENVKFDKILADIKEEFGDKAVPFALPIGEGENFKGVVSTIEEKAYEYNGKDVKEVEIPEALKDEMAGYNNELMEKIAETDEKLLERYFESEDFTQDEINKGLRLSLDNGDLIPVLVGSAEKSIGIDLLLRMISHCMPRPIDVGKNIGYKDEEKVEREVSVDEPFSAIVFKTIVDPFVGKLSLFKVLSGKINKDDEIYNVNKDKTEKLGGLFVLRGKEQINVSEIVAGDIGATAKLQVTETGDSLSYEDEPTLYDKIEYPQPTLFMAVEPKVQGEEEKVGTSLNRLIEEDPTFIIDRNAETKQLLIGGQGNMQLTVITDKLKNTFGVEVNLVNPKVAYRETIKGTSDVQGRHKKQSGGAGQYGDVHIKFEPLIGGDEEFAFEEEVFGGAVPRNYYPAVEKGLLESIEKGPLAGYPVVNLKATLYDGSYHPVDSNEMAFKIAATLAFRKGIPAANPILLEPVMRVEVLIPDNYMGDVMGDMNKRRGRILGMEPQTDGSQLIIAEAPQAELFEYAIDLRSMTQARGSFTMEFIRYDEVPLDIAEEIIEEANGEKE